MNMNKRYYVPEQSEFYIGFNYDYFINGFWRRGNNIFSDLREFGYKPEYELYPILEKQIIRVKYLDKEDIESLGFKENIYDINYFKFIQAYCNDVKINNFKCYNINKYQNLFFDNSNNAIYNIIITTTIGEKNIPKFIGTIKNKSELKQILKIIGYGC